MKFILQNSLLIITILLMLAVMLFNKEENYIIKGCLIIVFLINVYYTRKEYLKDKEES